MSSSPAVRFRRALLVVCAVAMAVLAGTAPALAADVTVSAEIRANRTADLIGNAQFVRTAAADGSEVLNVRLDVPRGMSESHICLASEPFTRRVPAGSCPYAQGATGTSAVYSIPLAASDVGRTVYVQAHVASRGDTAYAGWTDGQPGFYGNVAVAAPGDPTEVPPGALGGLGLAGILGVTILLMRRHRAVASR